MSSPVRILAILPLLLSSTVAGCDAVDRLRNRSAPADTIALAPAAGGLTLGLQVPGPMSPGEEGSVRLSVSNRGDTVASGLRLELIVPGWFEPLPPRVGDREVSMAAMEDGGTRFSYRLDHPALEPNQSQTVEQRVRIPTSSPITEGAVPWTRTVLARLIGPEGQALAEVESEIALEGGAAADTAGGAARTAPAGQRDQVGTVRLGMTAVALRQAAPGSRDTAWTHEGARRDALVVPAGSGGRALAMLDADSVIRIEVRDPSIRTQEAMGVGSRLEELRAAYGPACADVAEGGVVVWFANAPGLTFALDAPPPANAAQLRTSPEQIPATARVTRWWLRRGADRCPR
jgi:hypothetical protein